MTPLYLRRPLCSGPGSTTWDAEGVPTRRLVFVQQGVLQQFAYDLKTGYRYGEESTGSAVRSGSGSLASGFTTSFIDGPRIKDAGEERVVWIHDVVGAHTANPFSGDFSVRDSLTLLDGGRETGQTHQDGNCCRKMSLRCSGRLGDLEKTTSRRGRESLLLPSILLNDKQQIIGK